MTDLSDFISVLDDTPFESTPVDVRTFVTDKGYLGLPVLSDIQYDIVEAMSQIYYLKDLERYMTKAEAARHYNKYTKTEIILKLGKGTNIGSTMSWSSEYGYKRIDDKLEDYGLIQSKDTSNGATAFFSEGIDDVFTITTDRGYEFTGNAGHKFMVWKNSPHGKTYAMKKPAVMTEMATVSIGDIAMVYGDWDDIQTPYECSEDEALLIGYMIGDGTWLRIPENRNPIFTNATPEVQKDVIRIVQSLGGSVVEGKSGAGCWNIRINGLNDWFRRHGLCHKYYEKKIWNDNWMNMSATNLAALVRGVWATDGWANIQAKSYGYALSIAVEMNSESIIRGLHTALLRLGIFSHYRNNRPMRGNGKHNPTYRINIANRSDARMFVETVGIPIGKEIVFNGIYDLSKGAKRRTTIGDKIKSIKYAGKQEVFATIVETGHNYMGNGFIHSNSGKDHVSTIACAYLVYKLLLLKDPAAYYGKPSGDAIDILNIAINAQQAKNVFFKGFRSKIERSPWFRGRFDPKVDSIDFDKSISVYSGHSERESHEGLNLILVILDEISGFAIDNPSGLEKAKTADAIYNAFRGTIDSRFSMGKVVLLSFPRFDGCFISKRYDEVVAEKHLVHREYTFVINPELPHDDPENLYTLVWEEDHIQAYKFPGFFALCRPTWEVNPTKKIDDFKISFITNEADARTRFLAQPTTVSDAFFGRTDKIKDAMVHVNPLSDVMAPTNSFVPRPGIKYYMHADLAQKVDRCAVAISHVDKWVGVEYSTGYRTIQPYVVTDAIAYWKPGAGKPIDLKQVKDWIILIRSLGFQIDLVTFDRWNSMEMQRDLMSLGFKCETLSVAKKHYEDLQVILYEDRLRMPDIDVLFDEMKNLRPVKDRIEHPRSGGKDLSDALCGSVFNAATRSPRDLDIVVEIHDVTSHVDDTKYMKDVPIEISTLDDDELEVYLV